MVMILIEDVLTLLMMLEDCCQPWSEIAVLLSVCHDCHYHHCRIAFRLLLWWRPIVIAIVGSCSGCTWREDAMVTKMLIEDVLTLLMLIKGC